MTTLTRYWQRLLETWQRWSRLRLIRLALATYSSYGRTNCSLMAAGVAFYAMLSLLPLLIVMVSLLPLAMLRFFPHYDVRLSLQHMAQVTVSPVARRWLTEVLTSLKRNSAVVDGFSLLSLAWTASNVFGELDQAFKQILMDGGAQPVGASLRQKVLDQVRQRRNAFLLFSLALASFIAANVIGITNTLLQRNVSAIAGLPPLAWGAAAASWLVSGVFLSLLYRGWMPSQVGWLGCLLGAAVAASANELVRLLVANFVDSTIGAAYTNVGGPLALMLGVFLIIQNILVGAIVARQYTVTAVEPAG
jgi:membrane protein